VREITIETDQRTRALKIFKRLLKKFGEPVWGARLDPLDELVSTILSQNTNDRNRDNAFRSLKQRFPTWEQVRDAPLVQVIASIRTAGLANQKGDRIQRILQQITAERGSLDLAFLHDLPPEEARAWLMRFKGVGPKTAAIVLQFALGKPAFPVDTHILRVSGRLGLRPARMNAEQAHTHLAQLFPTEAYGAAHLNLIRLGRELCHPRNPECSRCPLQDLCNYNLENTSGR
jgi:endonuclease III